MRWFAAITVAALGCGRIGFGHGGNAGGGDGGDGSTGDGAGGPAVNCPAGYAYPSATSRYKLVTATSDWPTAEALCEAEGTGIHLIVLDSAAELTAAQGVTGYIRNWMGVSQRITAGTWR